MKNITTILLLVISLSCQSQSYHTDRVSFTNFLIRMYNDAPFDGVRAVNNHDDNFLISVLALDKTKYNSETVLNRIASVKAMAQASRFLNGSNITQDMIIHTTEKKDGTSDVEIIENIRENSAGYVKALEQLTNFTRKDGFQVFIFIKPLNIQKINE